MEYQIGDFAKISRLGAKTLRYYHEIGLLKPSRIDRLTGYRFYDENCLGQVETINQLKALSFSLDEIREIMASRRDDHSLLDCMEEKLQEVTGQISRYRDIQARIEAFIRAEEETTRPVAGEITVKDVPEMLVASMRYMGRYSDISDHLFYLFQTCGMITCGSPLSLYYDTHSMEDDADIENCLPVLRSMEVEGVTFQTLPAGRAVSGVHRGRYERIWMTYQKIVDFLHENHLEFQSPTREIYLSGKGKILPGNPDEYVTEIQFLIR